MLNVKKQVNQVGENRKVRKEGEGNVEEFCGTQETGGRGTA